MNTRATLDFLLLLEKLEKEKKQTPEDIQLSSVSSTIQINTHIDESHLLISQQNTLSSMPQAYKTLAKDNNNYSIVEEKFSVRERAFQNAIKIWIRDHYYVCKALQDEKVARKADTIDKLIETTQNVSPLIESKVENMGGSAVLFGINIVLSIIKLMRNQREKARAERIVEIFGSAVGPNENRIDKIAIAISLRYKDQINQLSLTESMQDNELVPSLQKNDGINVLAQRVVHHIIAHIMYDKDRFEEVAGEKFEMNLIKRCIKAILNTSYNEDNLDESTVSRQTENTGEKWTAKGIFTLTGAKNVNKPNQFYISEKVRFRGDYTRQEKYGFCYVREEDWEWEIKERGLHPSQNSNDTLINNNVILFSRSITQSKVSASYIEEQTEKDNTITPSVEIKTPFIRKETVKKSESYSSCCNTM